MVDVERSSNGVRVSGLPTPTLEEQIQFAEGVAKRDRDYWTNQVRKRLANEVYAAQRIVLADSVVKTLKGLAQGDRG